jgi:hypothetical protein
MLQAEVQCAGPSSALIHPTAWKKLLDKQLVAISIMRFLVAQTG